MTRRSPLRLRLPHQLQPRRAQVRRTRSMTSRVCRSAVRALPLSRTLAREVFSTSTTRSGLRLPRRQTSKGPTHLCRPLSRSMDLPRSHPSRTDRCSHFSSQPSRARSSRTKRGIRLRATNRPPPRRHLQSRLLEVVVRQDWGVSLSVERALQEEEEEGAAARRRFRRSSSRKRTRSRICSATSRSSSCKSVLNLRVKPQTGLALLVDLARQSGRRLDLDPRSASREYK